MVNKAHRANQRNLGILRIAAVMTAAMCVAAIPGFWLAPYSINLIDEPYQMLNAIDWQNAVYSPLSSFLANLFGRLFDFRYLAFRYLALSLNFITVYICALYALRLSSHKSVTIITAIFSTLFFLFDQTDYNLYGWDRWSDCLLACCIVGMLGLLRRPSITGLLLYSLASATAALMRLPDFSLVPLSLVIFIYHFKRSKTPSPKAAAYCTLYVLATFLFYCIGITALYGSPATYINLFSQNSITAHSVGQMTTPLVNKTLLALVFAFLFYAVFLLIKKIEYSGISVFLRYFIYLLAGAVLFIAMIPTRGQTVGLLPSAATGLLFLCIFAGMRRYRHPGGNFIFTAFLAILLLGMTGAIGSNVGIKKFFTWGAFPLVSALWGVKIVRPAWVCGAITVLAFCFFEIYLLFQPRFCDFKISELNYTMEDPESRLYGMKTFRHNGKIIEKALYEARYFQNLGYTIIPVRTPAQFIWEYALGTPLPFRRHTFYDWDALKDPEYTGDIKDLIFNTPKPMVMYMHCDTSPPFEMQRMLDDNMIRVIDGPAYNFYSLDNPIKYQPIVYR